MIAMDRRSKLACLLIASAVAGTLGPRSASAQLSRFRTPPSQSAAKDPAPAPAAAPTGEAPTLKEVRVPVNTTDPIAIVNGEIITRQQLADECVAREGQKILDTLIARRLIDQAIRGQKKEVTPQEVDQEIDRVAMATAGVDRTAWLRNLEKEKGISPAQYARDIIYPALALRKLAEPRVQVTEQDIKDAFEANFSPRMRCRIIMCRDVRTANEIWEELRKNPGGFERLAKDRSLDQATRSSGGMLPDPMARHAHPRNVSDPAFAQLVDGDPKDNNPAHKPKDGDFSGPIQVNDEAWIIIKREELVSVKTGSLSDPNVRNTLQAQMFDVKLNDEMKNVYEDLMKASKIENKLTGFTKLAHEEQDPDYKSGLDAKVQRMSAAGETEPPVPTGGKTPANIKTTPAAGAAKIPAGVPAGAAQAASQLQQAIKASTPKVAPKN
ncbi:peptidylprolyl isomerase [Tundrisphaera lichenicola]|uniref:peptidylprolyl isomerase n=1 Tax=Tundrisphaera lichenicola TaxID=2029860 RepID=UPI003EC0FB7C